MKDYRCDIILPVCDQFDFTKNCIDSIIANTTTQYKLIVINNGSNHKTSIYLNEVKKQLGDKLHIKKNATNVGWVKALNQGFEISDAPYICFQNDDTIVTIDWINRMIDILNSNNNVGLVNPAWEGRPDYMSIEDYGKLLYKKHGNNFIETDWARGFSVVMKREVLDKIGGIDEIYGLAYFDDVDYSVRAINAGFRVVLARGVYVYHHRNVTFFQVLKGNRWNELHEKNKLIYYERWGRPLKVVMVLDKAIFESQTSADKIVDTVYYLARKQHHIDIWCPPQYRNKFPHTNITIKAYAGLLRWIVAFTDIWFNSMKKPVKRYDAIIILDKNFRNMVNGTGMAQKNTIFVDSSNNEFDRIVKKNVDDLKERTKKPVNV